MDGGDTHGAHKNDLLKHEDPLKKYGLLKSRKLFRQEEEQHSICGKWLKMVKSSPKVSCEVSTSPSHFLSKVVENYEADESKSKVSASLSKTLSSPSIDFSQGTLEFTMRGNDTPNFVFKLENQKDIYEACLSSNVKDQGGLDYSYTIHLQNGVSSSSSSSSNLVGRINVSTSSSGSLLNESYIEREFVLFTSSNGEHNFMNKNRGLPKKVVKNDQITSTFKCSWDKKPPEPSFENKFSTNLEALAVVVKQELPEEKTGGWGLKFLKKSRLVQTNAATETSALISMDVVTPSGIHGGPQGGPLSLIERWKSQGSCDCGGWDLGCPLTFLKGQPREDHFELFIEVTFYNIQFYHFDINGFI